MSLIFEHFIKYSIRNGQYKPDCHCIQTSLKTVFEKKKKMHSKNINYTNITSIENTHFTLNTNKTLKAPARSTLADYEYSLKNCRIPSDDSNFLKAL